MIHTSYIINHKSFPMADIPRIVLAGGVSGGHTFPLIAVASALKKKFPGGIEFLFIGPQGRFESDAMTAEGIPSRYILTGKMRRYFSVKNFIDFFRLPVGLVQALWHLFLFMPDVVFSKGGSASVPVVIAAWLYRIPVMIHDSDAVAGRANRFAAHFAQRIAIAYPGARDYFSPKKTALTGNPVRAEILYGKPERAVGRFRLSLERPTLLVLGGSQGASVLNIIVLKILVVLLREGIQVIHQTGDENYDEVVQAAKEAGVSTEGSGYIPKAFLDAEEMADALALATVVLSRSGASSIAELAATKKSALLVPLASAANDEQRMNAYDIAEIGGAVVLEEPNLGENMLLEKIHLLVGDAGLRSAMGEKIHTFYHPDAADLIAEGLYRMMPNR